MLQNTAVKATLGEKQKHAALSLLLPVADLDAVQARKVMARLYRTAGHKTRNDFYEKGQKAKLISEYIPTAA